MELFALSTTELGALFGVTRQTIDGWRASRVPPDRRAKLGDVLELADLLERKVKPDRIAVTVHRAAAAYGGRTMLELIAADQHAWLLSDTRSTFAWSQPA